MLIQCWTTVTDGGPTLNQQWFIYLCMLDVLVPAMSVNLTLMYTSLLALLFSRIHGSHEFIDISNPMDFLANLILDFTCRRHNLPCKMSEADLKSGHIYSKPFHVPNCEYPWSVDPLILPNCQLLSIFIQFKLK